MSVESTIQNWGQTVRPLINQLDTHLETLYSDLQTLYAAAGSPHGASASGFRQWVKEEINEVSGNAKQRRLRKALRFAAELKDDISDLSNKLNNQ